LNSEEVAHSQIPDGHRLAAKSRATAEAAPECRQRGAECVRKVVHRTCGLDVVGQGEAEFMSIGMNEVPFNFLRRCFLKFLIPDKKLPDLFVR
jgi:hypothetical protein